MVEPSSNIRRFIRDRLSADGSILALGEAHTFDEHLHYLKDEIPYLKSCGVKALGLEMPVYMDIMFEAYADGTLAACFGGSRQKAGEYITHLRVLSTRASQFHDNIRAETALALEAIDQGIKVVCYDARHEFSAESRLYLRAQERFKDSYPHYTNGALGEKQLQQLRQWDGEQKTLSDGLMLSEVTRLFSDNAHFKSKIDAQKQFCDACDQRQIPNDQRNALYMRALVSGTAMALGGNAHLSGMAGLAQSFEGTFADHLAHVKMQGRPAPKVTSAVVAGTGMIDYLRDVHEDRLRSESEYILAADDQAMLNIDNDTIASMPRGRPHDVRLCDWKTKLRIERNLGRYDPFLQEYADPMLWPDVRVAVENLQKAYDVQPYVGRA